MSEENNAVQPVDQSAEQQQPKQKVTFSPEQQARVDEIVRESMGRAAKDLRAENFKLRTELDAAKVTATPQNDGTAHLATELATIKAERDSLRERQTEGSIREQLRKAADAEGFVDVDLAISILRTQVQLTDGKLLPVAADGTPRLGATLDPMSLQELSRELANSKPFLVRSNVKPGIGSAESSTSLLAGSGIELERIFGANSNAGEANRLAMIDPKKYSRLRALAREKGLLPR